LMHYQQQWQAAQQLLGSDTQRWLLLGIAQKIKMANLYLHFTHDARAVSVVLQQIDRQLQRLHNDALLPLRQALASDLARLQGINPPDLPGILSQLSALQERINVLPVQALPTQTTHAATPTESAAANAEWSWRTAWQQTWRALQTIVLVRHHTVPPAPLLDQQQASYLRQNLFLLLQQTKWAALREDTTLYQQSLQQTTQWLQRYFIYAEQATQPIVAQLTQLQQIDIAPTLPTLAASQRAIRDIVHKPVQQQGS
jgi:uroporphyrin-3 C-methyltransferase